MKELGYHIPTAFKNGERVRLVDGAQAAHAWFGRWSPELNSRIGSVFYIKKVDTLLGFFLTDLKASGWVPSTCLKLIPDEVAVTVPAIDAVTSKQLAPAIINKQKKKKSRTQKPGPWDAAPCTHLKWHLMGFYKEKLTMSVTQVTSVQTGKVFFPEFKGDADVTFSCSKCGTSTSVKAPMNIKG